MPRKITQRLTTSAPENGVDHTVRIAVTEYLWLLQDRCDDLDPPLLRLLLLAAEHLHLPRLLLLLELRRIERGCPPSARVRRHGTLPLSENVNDESRDKKGSEEEEGE